ncbi:MAG: 30S ribosomal protein S7 [Candidatus Margulisiibacteriota bacterium]|jgi:small subunit ribosomal protein S7
MSRRKRDYYREITPDPVFNDKLITKFINKLMYDGKKSIAEKIVYCALRQLAEKVNEQEINALDKVLNNVTPLLEVKSRRVGGSTYQVPIEVEPKRGQLMAIKWIILNSRNRKGKSMIDKLAAELIDSYNKTGASIKKREDTHKMAESNKAFAHFRW